MIQMKSQPSTGLRQGTQQEKHTYHTSGCVLSARAAQISEAQALSSGATGLVIGEFSV